ncbi:MAG TPA: exonuclease domain-containing protein [Solirubrobacteraceae bacterium]
MRRRPPREGAAAAFQSTSRPALTQPWRQTPWCAVDLELTGLDPRRHEIIALGAVPIEEGRVALGRARYTLVRPTHAPKHDAVLVHKLRLADLLEAPSIEYAVDLLLETLAGRVPVFHTAAIERAFLTPLLAARRVRLPSAADTEVLGRLWLRERDGRAPPGIALSRLSGTLGLPAEPPHHALGDAITTAQVFVAVASHLDRSSPQTVASLLHAGAQFGGATRMGPGR